MVETGGSSGGESGTASGAESAESNETTSGAATTEMTIYSTLWFIGIELKPNNEALELNISDVILGFKDLSKLFIRLF